MCRDTKYKKQNGTLTYLWLVRSGAVTQIYLIKRYI